MKHDYIISISGALSGALLTDVNLLLSSAVYLITGVYTAYKLTNEIKNRRKNEFPK
jgi:hypothetical protein